jgi:SAM-dependent methyltransferase
MAWRKDQAWHVTKMLARKMGLQQPYGCLRHLLHADPPTAGDVPVSQAVWDQQYALGTWEYMREPEELGRYALLEGYIKKLRLKSLLDIGCGEGILLEYLWPYPYEVYVGVDVSATALQRAALKSSQETRFIQADAATFQAPRAFDAVLKPQGTARLIPS